MKDVTFFSTIALATGVLLGVGGLTMLDGCSPRNAPQPRSTLVCEDAITHATTYAAESYGNWHTYGGREWHAVADDGITVLHYQPAANERCVITNR